MTSGGRNSLTDCYNRARRRLRSRRSDEPETGADSAAAEAAIAAFNGQQWEPPSGPFMQQVAPGWRLGLSWRQLACLLSLLALVNGCLACGGFACWMGTAEVELAYTDCADAVPAVCRLRLEVKSNLTGPLYLYYALSSAYFNHRRIQTAWSMRQLLGLPVVNPNKSCRGHAYRGGGRIVLPCGALPNAIFNDTFAILGPVIGGNETLVVNSTAPEIPMSTEGISWASHTLGLYPPLSQELLSDTAAPDSWPVPAHRRYRRPFADAGDLHAWLRTPAFPSFRKMSHHLDPPSGGLPGGVYQVVIGYNYPVSGFGGGKRLIIAEKSLLGVKNFVLVLLPSVTAVCYLLLCVLTLIKCHCRPHRPRNLSITEGTE